MKDLKTSTKVLISLIAAAVVLSVVLLLTIPEPWVDSFRDSHAFIFDGTAPDFDFEDGEGFHRFNRYDGYHSKRGSAHGLGGILFIGLILLFIFKRKRFHGRKNHSRAIIDELFAEEKIGEDEYRRRRAVIEEEGK